MCSLSTLFLSHFSSLILESSPGSCIQWTTMDKYYSTELFPGLKTPIYLFWGRVSHTPYWPQTLWSPYPSVFPSLIPGLQTCTPIPNFAYLFLCGDADKALCIDKRSWDQLSHISSLSLVLLGVFCSNFFLYQARNIGYLSLFITLWTDVQHIYQVSSSLNFIPVTCRVLKYGFRIYYFLLLFFYMLKLGCLW